METTGFSRKVLLLLGRRFLFSGLIALALPLIMLFVFGFSIKTTAEYDCVMQTVEQSPQVTSVTGVPIRPGLFAWTSFFESGQGVRRGQFSTSVSGPLGRGTVRAFFYRSPVGQTLTIWFRTSTGEFTVYDGSYPCRR